MHQITNTRRKLQRSSITKTWTWSNKFTLFFTIDILTWFFTLFQTLMTEEYKDTVQNNLFKSYKLMLDFYGMKIIDENSNKLCRTEHYEERYNNLIRLEIVSFLYLLSSLKIFWRNTHNFLRITRILKCLGEFEMHNHQFGFMEFLIEETFETFELYPLASSLTRLKTVSYYFF